MERQAGCYAVHYGRWTDEPQLNGTPGGCYAAHYGRWTDAPQLNGTPGGVLRCTLWKVDEYATVEWNARRGATLNTMEGGQMRHS
ncbi:hypothetical protein NDU88_000360 [Pleurodeles waltl]|uniref:Uncharacterized protein n=1 Tax=Pleurodeles waltl TaxID=8319 RepID=A0AAV7WF98_PLEWA|nr:hypothetical protein NDU88_000360 [Pleurodeles waltl]